MAVVDRNLLRAAVAEMLGYPNTPAAIIINESLEIARRYAAPESVQFLNGVLDAIARTPSEAAPGLSRCTSDAEPWLAEPGLRNVGGGSVLASGFVRLSHCGLTALRPCSLASYIAESARRIMFSQSPLGGVELRNAGADGKSDRPVLERHFERFDRLP